MAGQQREKPEWLGSPQNEHVGRRGQDWERSGECRRGVGPGPAGSPLEWKESFRRLEAMDRNGVSTRAKTKSEKVRRTRKHLIGARINWSQGRSGCISANENVRSLEKGGRK